MHTVCVYRKREMDKQKSRPHLVGSGKKTNRGRCTQRVIYFSLKSQRKYPSLCTSVSGALSAIDLFLYLLASMTHPKSSFCERQGRLDVVIVTVAVGVFTPTAHLSKRRWGTGDEWRHRSSFHYTAWITHLS